MRARTSPATAAGGASPASKRLRSFCARAVPWLALALTLGVLVQAALGAYTTWSDWSYGSAHRGFVHVLRLAVVLLAVAGFVARDWRAGIIGVVLFVLIGVQYGLIRGSLDVRPLHIVSAFVMFGLPLSLAQARWPWAAGRKTAGP